MHTDFYNTNQTTGHDLAISRRKARTQQQKILDYFQIFAGLAFTPSMIHQAIFKESTPITSVRRAISNLTDDGKLTKTDRVKPGLLGKQEHYWRLS